MTLAIPQSARDRYLGSIPSKVGKVLTEEERHLAGLAAEIDEAEAIVVNARAKLVEAKLNGGKSDGAVRRLVEAEASASAITTAHARQAGQLVALRDAYVTRQHREELSVLETKMQQARADYAVAFPQLEQAAKGVDESLRALAAARDSERNAASAHAVLSGRTGSDIAPAATENHSLPGHSTGEATIYRSSFGKGSEALGKWLAFHRPSQQSG